MNEVTTLNGIIHGDTIKLAADPHMRDGEEVTVVIKGKTATLKPGDGIVKSAGIVPDEAEDDRLLEQIQRERHAASRRELPE